MRITLMSVLVLVSSYCIMAQQTESLVEKLVPLSEPAVALDKGALALEATLHTEASVKQVNWNPWTLGPALLW